MRYRFCTLALFAASTVAWAAPVQVTAQITAKSGDIRSGAIPLPRLAPGHGYTLLFSVASPASFAAGSRLEVTLADGQRILASKTLHAGDPDLYTPFHITSAASPELRLSAIGLTGRYTLQINQWPESPALKSGGNHTWQDASPIVLGKTVFASSDESEYIPLPGVARKDAVTNAAGEDWYRFTFNSPKPQLVYFQIELMDRDYVPVDVSVFRVVGGKLTEFTEGQDPVAVPHEVQALPGNKFAPRVLSAAGDYYVRVRANHPEYKLRTRTYPVPPYDDPQQAVRAADDYILGAGDSWFANTPRRGGIINRVESVHQETSLCVGCHPSHFSQRAAVYAAANGYPVHQRQQLLFLSERFYNNPRPFYGFENEGAVWARVISAPANVLSRMSLITNLFETQISGEPRKPYHDAINKYLDLYYAGRTQLPPDETNGNTPLVSAFEVGWYSWKGTHDPRLPEQMAAAPVKNMIDLCYQTQALADIDRTKYADLIAKNAQRILSLQRPDGQWSMKFEPDQAEVEFQTGHTLWALAAAGIPRDNPQVKKAIDYLMKRQQTFGGWMDPLQSFENFKTPFRETQFAILALSTYFPKEGRKPGWNSPVIESLPSDPTALLDALDNLWDKPSPTVIRQIEAATKADDVLVRQAAAEALGRMAIASSLPAIMPLLADPSKLVQRTAAWAIREIYSRHADVPSAPLLTALNSDNDRTRWGATRVFAQHFAELARCKDFITALESHIADPDISTRLNAVRGLWQSWFWNADPATRGGIEDSLLAALAKRQHPWIASNLRAGVYNLADENIRYLYNNWVPLMGREEDRERAIRGRLAIESQLGDKFSKVLETGSDLQKKQLLEALTELPLRRGDIYDLDADLSKPAPLIYSRIGNDIEQIAFFGSTAERFARALAPLLDSPDPETHKYAQEAALLVRDAPFPAVNKLAGERGAAIQTISERIDSSPDAAEVAKALHPPVRGGARVAAVSQRRELKLDRAYFTANVDPILRAKGKDGYACVDCHATHTLFNATWSTIANVIDIAHPEDSLVLRKPTSTSETEGVVGAAKLAHGGGQRWPKESPEYQTILKWIQGAK
jgi:HEAT repeat protein